MPRGGLSLPSSAHPPAPSCETGPCLTDRGEVAFLRPRPLPPGRHPASHPRRTVGIGGSLGRAARRRCQVEGSRTRRCGSRPARRDRAGRPPPGKNDAVTRSRTPGNRALMGLVFLAGIGSMTVEICASRLLAPF